MDVQERYAHAELIAEEYSNFQDFAADGMAFLGFDITWEQDDIAQYMANGPQFRMVMAQRGEAKSTLAALYAVWRIVQRCSTRVLVVSGGEKQASEVAFLIIRIITTWEILTYLRPDKTAGDRTSVEAFDVHWCLKGTDKSPSVACVGITANLPGKRADLLIPDDIETPKNSMTVTNRETLLQLSKEFTSICTHGDILYLGTPQTKDSIYNTLPARGFDIRIWPGRYPNNDELEKYGDKLAPSIAERIAADPSLQTGAGLDGTRGKPTDPDRFDEEELIKKEIDKGPEDFQLQHMLDTSLSDAMRQQLKLSNFLVANYDSERIPEITVYQEAPRYLVELPKDFPVHATKMYHPVAVECTFVKPSIVRMFIDPAGGGGDELAWGISTAVGPWIHVLEVGGVIGGLTKENGIRLCQSIAKYNVTHIVCESNMGHGSFEINMRALLAENGLGHVGVAGEYSTGQKERRIITRIGPTSTRHRIILHKGVFESDAECSRLYSIEKRKAFSLFYQIANITSDRDSLTKDDRIEAFAGCINLWKDVLLDDENSAERARKAAELHGFLSNPMGYSTVKTKADKGTRSITHRRRLRK
jgi:hypothetical protein